MNKSINSIDVETMRRNANNQFSQGRNCAQSAMLGICSVTGSRISEDDILAISAGFSGGIGNTYDEGTCGALIVGVMCLGLLYGKGLRTIEMSKELYQDFKSVYGSPRCIKVIETVRDHECVGCCFTVIDKIADIIQREEAAVAEAAKK